MGYSNYSSLVVSTPITVSTKFHTDKKNLTVCIVFGYQDIPENVYPTSQPPDKDTREDAHR